MRVGVPREILAGERRAALVPETIEKLTKAGLEVLVETGAGRSAFISDDAYRAAGASLGDAREAFAADLVVKIHRPAERPDGGHEVELLREGGVFAAVLQPMVYPELAQRLATRRITAFSMDAIPRIARAQALDVLSSMSSIAGYRAVVMAAAELPRFFPMLMTAAGTVTPARVLILGAGVAGLQAIATARRLGAVVEAFDTRPVVKEQVESLGARFIDASIQAAQDRSGYATALSEDAHQRELEVIGERVKEADVVITTALIPGQRAPLLITADMVRTMRGGSVIVDLAGEFGGNCELSTPGETVVQHDVTIQAPLNLPAGMPVHASQMFSRNVAAFLQLIVKDGALHLDFNDQIVKDACITHEGAVVHEGTRARLA
jgi:H+-translocating NAD(P) transhydrogenase subunit alpha